MLDTILFDLDGTLLPFSEEAFTGAYFKALTGKLAPLGFEPDALVKAVWGGTKAMILNDGGKPNCDVFWAKFEQLLPGCDVETTRGMCDEFYTTEFDAVRAVLGDAAHSARVVRTLLGKGYTLALATNPVFPMVAVQTRLAWIGLDVNDFTLVTSYENSSACKPNPLYYQSILDQLGKRPADCLMVGNSVAEDMAFEGMGGHVYLITDHMENGKGMDYASYPQGSMEAFSEYVDALPGLNRA